MYDKLKHILLHCTHLGLKLLLKNKINVYNWIIYMKKSIYPT